MSDIFNEFAKLAIDKGLIKEAKEEESKKRHDSLTIDDIKSLYGVKPNGEDEKHILDQAHPESVVVAPAYDKLNGLVENLFERQDVMTWIATKPNDGKHTQERYIKANKDLTMSLLNTAMMLDRTGDHKLMALADNCAHRLTKSALAPLVILGLKLGVGALVTMGLVNNFGGMIDNGVSSNSKRAIEELNDVLSSGSLSGKETAVQDLIVDIQFVHDLNQHLLNFNIDPKQDNAKSKIAEGEALLAKYIKAVKLLNVNITHMLNIAQAQSEMGDGNSWISDNLGDIGIALEKAISFLWTNELQDILPILETLKGSLENSIESTTKLYNSIKAKAESRNTESLAEILKIDGIAEEQEGSGFKQEREAVGLKSYVPEDLKTPQEK